MRLVLLLVMLCGGLVGQVTPAKNIQVGLYSCAGRMLGPTTFQNWCYKDKKLVVNSVMEILEGSISSLYSDSAVDPPTPNMILWIVTSPNIYSVSIKSESGVSLTMNGVF